MLISLIFTLVIADVVLYLIGLIPMDAAIYKLVRAVVIIAAVLYVLSALLPGWHRHLL